MTTQEDEYARLLAQANYELAAYGQTTEDTQDALADHSSGVKGLSKATKAAYTGVKQLGDAVGKTASAMYEGKQGASAYNGALDSMSDAAGSASKALFFFGGPFGMIAGAIAFLIGVAIKATKVVNEQLDNNYSAYKELSKSGAAAGDGMEGAFAGIQKLRMDVKDFKKYGDLIANNAKELAIFGGTVAGGRKKFEDATQALEPYRKTLLKLGEGTERQAEGMLAFIASETRYGRAQNKRDVDMAASYEAYVKEQDLLTKITGVERSERESARADALKQQQYASKLQSLENSGQKDVADRFKEVSEILASNPELRKAYQASITGNFTDAESRKLLNSSNGKIIELNAKLAKGTITGTEFVSQLNSSIKDFSDSTGNMAAQTEQNDKFALTYESQLKARNDVVISLVDREKAAKDEQEGQLKKLDKPTENMIDAEIANTNAMLNAQKAVQAAAPAASKAMLTMAQATEQASRRALGLAEGKWYDYFFKQSETSEMGSEADMYGGSGPAVPYTPPAKPAEQPPAKLPAKPAEQPPAKPAEKPPAKPAEKPPATPAEQPPATPAEQPPAAPAPSKEQVSQRQLAERGLKVKKGDVQAENASLSTKMLEVAQQVQSSVPGFAYFSGFNDKYHQEKSPASQHTKGLAADFTLTSAPDEATGKKISSDIKGMGASMVIDEYNHPSSKATAGHIHFQVPEARAALGGVFPAKSGGTHVLLAEGGQDEAVIPMKDGAVQVSMKNQGPLSNMAHPDIDAMLDEKFSSTVSADIREDLRAVVMDIVRQLQPVSTTSSGMSQAVLEQLDQLIAYQKEANDIDNRMLAVASN